MHVYNKYKNVHDLLHIAIKAVIIEGNVLQFY